MKLSEFYKERMAANPELTRLKLVDAVGSATVYAIQHDVPRKFRKSTLHKLAELWKCSVGDIQACLAELPNPLRAEAERPEGNAGISITAGAGKSKKKTAPTPDPEEPAEVFQPEPELPFSEPDPDEQPKNTEVKAELLTHSFRAGRRDCLQELKDMLVQASAETQLGEDELGDMYAAFGWAVARLIAAEDAAYREAEK